MSRYRGPRLRIIRRIGKLPGLTRKTSKKNNPPGQHTYNKKLSEYSIRLKEKQKLRFNYGITERQLLNYIKKARKRKGSSGIILLTLLEMRLDNIIFQLGLAPTIMSSRQLISHGHILVNEKEINICSYICKPTNTISIKKSITSKTLIQSNLTSSNSNQLPQHLSLNKDLLQGRINNLVNRKTISLIINELLIIEFYSRKL
uniref:Small ribosomal subunit protein uS4c n=1 Tax=Euglenaformis proxima TaxID=299110 RepID=A0A023HHN2_9EUGL|nr:ribosomal protein S4 [Euglenaformis proxima]AGL11977.1 ribosomal protein S4 [Euglenaformis proxima]